jgi:hypothetical protein
MAETRNGGEVEHEVGRTKHRSPNYPVMVLREAVDRAEVILKKYRRAAVPVNLVQLEWGYKPHSSIAKQSVAALKYYGLVEVEGTGDTTRVKISDLAYRIILGSSDRADLLKKAALNPSLHEELWEEFGGKDFADDSLIKHYLLFDREEGKFNADAVDRFIANFRATLDYAGLLQSGKIPEGTGKPTEERGALSISVGDFVQWTSAGTDQFPEPRRVTTISDDGQWALVEGSNTGVSMSELTIQKPKGEPQFPTKGDHPQFPPSPFYRGQPATLALGMTQDAMTLDEGMAILHWPAELSQDSVAEFEYWMQGLIRRARRKAGLPRDK